MRSGSDMEFKHISILLPQCMEALKIDPNGVYVDATTGGGGHSLAIAQRLQSGRLICIDRDDDALAAAKARLSPVLQRVTFIKSSFAELDHALDQAGVGQINGILFDLGVSSYQLDEPERGFSYQHDGPLDMRMDRSQKLSAYQIVNDSAEEELVRILFEYGEEKFARRIAAEIVRMRKIKPIETTGELSEMVRRAMPPAARREKQHPAKRTFQAIRIAVNSELDEVNRAVCCAVQRLSPGGRIAVITFHSLEDRIVKSRFSEYAKGCTCPPDFPVCVCGKKPVLRLTPRKAIVPDAQEIQENPRARSAKLRVAEKI